MRDVGVYQIADPVSHQVGFAFYLPGDFRYAKTRLPSGQDDEVSGVFVHFHVRSISGGRGDSQGAIFW